MLVTTLFSRAISITTDIRKTTILASFGLRYWKELDRDQNQEKDSGRYGGFEGRGRGEGVGGGGMRA